MSYNPTTRPASGAQRRDIRNRMLNRGWYPLPGSIPKSCLLLLPQRQGPSFIDGDRVDVAWTEVWCVCLWARLTAARKNSAREFALELKKYKQYPRAKKALLITSLVGAESMDDCVRVAINRAIELLQSQLLDAPANRELQHRGPSGQ